MIMEENKEKNSNSTERSIEKEELNKKTRRRINNMPSQYEGKGPQQNSAVGYDPLEDI